MSDTRQSAASGPQADRNLTPIATLIEDPARSAMLAALAGGRALPAGELARRAGVQPGTASVAGALPAAITSVFLARGWLSDAPGRSLHVAERFDDKIDEWLAA